MFIFKLFFHTKPDELDQVVALLDSLKHDLARLMCSLAVQP